MGHENGGSRGFWPSEDEVVPLASATAIITGGVNGDRAEGDRTEEPPLARTPRLSAGEFTPERMIRPTTESPTRGWRRTLFLLTGGLVTIGPTCTRAPASALRRAPTSASANVAVGAWVIPEYCSAVVSTGDAPLYATSVNTRLDTKEAQDFLAPYLALR